jgi:hypothetical protein
VPNAVWEFIDECRRRVPLDESVVWKIKKLLENSSENMWRLRMRQKCAESGALADSDVEFNGMFNEALREAKRAYRFKGSISVPAAHQRSA